MKTSLVWPKSAADQALARQDAAGLLHEVPGGSDAVHELEARITDLVRGKPTAIVCAALAISLGKAAAFLYGAVTPRALGSLAVVMQVAWHALASNQTKH